MSFCLRVPALFRLALVAPLLGGCVYYNGMYNANRWPGPRGRPNVRGVPIEANNLWGQVATKAESVVVRHPTASTPKRPPCCAELRSPGWASATRR